MHYRRTKLTPKRTTTVSGGGFPYTLPLAATTPVSDGFTVTDPVYLRVDIFTSDITANGANTVQFGLQECAGQDANGDDVWTDSKQGAVFSDSSTDTLVTIKLLPQVTDDQPFLPLPGKMRVVATTAQNGTATIEKIFVLS